MKAVTWQGKRNVEVKEIPDPIIKDPTDIIIKVTSTCICGSDLHLYEVMAPVRHAYDSRKPLDPEGPSGLLVGTLRDCVSPALVVHVLAVRSLTAPCTAFR